MAYKTDFNTALLALVTDLTSAEKVQFSELLFSKAFAQSDITQTHRLITGIRDGSIIPIMKSGLNYSSFPFVDENVCSTNDCTIDTKYSAHKWDLGLIECRLGICMREFSTNFLQFWNQYKITAPDPDLNTALLTYISDEFKWAHLGAQWRVTYFGDKSLVANSLLNGIDGFFTQAEANQDQIVGIVENNATTFVGQKFTSGLRVYEILTEVYNKYAEQPWFGATDLEFKMTRLTASTLVAYLNSLKSTECCEGFARVNPDGMAASAYTIDNLTFNGIKIKVMQDWDNVINTVPALNGGGGNAARVNPHRILLTYTDNLLIGTTSQEALNTFKIWYSEDDDKVYLKGGSYIGAGIPMRDEYILAI